MNNHNTIINLSRIKACDFKTCDYCGGHFQPLYRSHQLCNNCYYGNRQGEAIAKAVKYQELSNDLK